MHTLVWWSVWGLVIGTALFGLQQSKTYSISLILAIPLLTGALAAAVLKLRHEYQEALEHAKWFALTLLFFLLGSGYLYLKTRNVGPFATASTHKAFLGVTFEMSIHEVERALGRKLITPFPTASQSPESIKDWVIELLPQMEQPLEVRTLSGLVLYGVNAQGRFEFNHGRLAVVEIAFEPKSISTLPPLMDHLREELAKTYKAVPRHHEPPLVYRKEAIEAILIPKRIDEGHVQVTIRLRYLPLVDTSLEPLAASTEVF